MFSKSDPASNDSRPQQTSVNKIEVPATEDTRRGSALRSSDQVEAKLRERCLNYYLRLSIVVSFSLSIAFVDKDASLPI